MKKVLLGNRLLIFVIFLFFVSLFAALPRQINIQDREINLPEISWQVGQYSFSRDLEPKLGLDIRGGSRIVFEADMSKVDPQDRDSALTSAKETVERRVNLFGVSEPVVQTSKIEDKYRIVADLPGVTDVTQAVNLIGKTAQLFFATVEQQEETSQATPSAVLLPTDLTGADLTRAQVEFDSNTGKPLVGLQFNETGAKKFEEITAKNISKPVVILIDNQIVSSPTVNEKISGGRAVITGDFAIPEAKQIVTLLNSGALPVPLDMVEQRTIGPTLGQEAINKSVFAGVIGVLAVALFMVLYYGRLGIIATVALLMYGVFALAIFKSIPVVLTLPGVAGFLLSIGMAVDSNILTFERYKEEIRRGLGIRDALEAGFGRAWDSIRDANIATLLTSFILFNPLNWEFLHTSGPVRGFAATLAIGVLLSLFTGVVVTRTLLRTFVRK
ncbi:protein translocase subunit SecD [Candidatus Microgenomates bacterium]|nr:protein translocase subunit SecD [Candidatus Microgenomates bacterium]